MSRVELGFARMMRGLEAPMTPDSKRKIDELASDIDDLTITADELETDSSVDARAEVARLKRALEEASSAG
jgi:outer membrane murein-binding lipoprotein Lpp